ncbi:Uu.00g115920.m01.CDS01 [Anthostomella pinea]|uniref:Uu.00g115920.m01.CDS01 n=1 Tax=Anthostomella pinea TaxID=933095 RepID=A0AAI8YED2_9PEZI|nr:Uu.00g115920.m01.CDS01 [Anthostomella pinea]
MAWTLDSSHRDPEKGEIAKAGPVEIAIGQDAERQDAERQDHEPEAVRVARNVTGLGDPHCQHKEDEKERLLEPMERGQEAKGTNEAKDEWERPDEDNDFRISFAELQRMRLQKLQCRLVRHVANMKNSSREPDGWEEDLEAYIKAIQDYDYMVTCSQRPRDPFLVTGERKIDSYVIHSILRGSLNGGFGRPIPVDNPWENDNQPIGGTRNATLAKSWIDGFKERLIIATVAGFFLIGPMWLMVLHDTLYTTLGSTTAFVTAFGIAMAWFLDKPKEVMSGTAAYAAVLVVFVGLAVD